MLQRIESTRSWVARRAVGWSRGAVIGAVIIALPTQVRQRPGPRARSG